MNKKLFFAGFALLAAVSFTSCNSDNPIDITNPNGVTPAAATHYVGGEYDWTAIAKDYTQLKEFWAKDKADLAKAIAEKKTINILLDVSGYELKNEEIALPDFWQDGKTAGKVVNITFDGNFKSADFERADAIKNGAKATKYPVKINTNNLAGAEVNFTFNVEMFDLELTTDKVRSTFSGDYIIGYLKAVAAEKLSATEFKSGIVEGLDYASTGDFKGEIAGVWVKTAPAAAIQVTDKGIKVGQNADYTVFGKNVFVEDNTELNTWCTSAKKDAQFTLGTVMFVKGAVLTLGGTKDSDGKPAVDAIESILGFNKDVCLVMTQGLGKDFSKIDAVEKVTVFGGFAGNTITLEKDIFTDVEFNDPIIFNTDKTTAFDNVTFNDLKIEVNDNDQTLNFTAVKFDKAPVNITSSMEIENKAETTTTKTTIYQWIVGDGGAATGYYEEVDKNHALKEYNKTEEVKEYTYAKGKEKLTFTANGKDNGYDLTGGDDAADASKYKVIKMNVVTTFPAGKVTLIPEGTIVTMDKDCKFVGATSDAALNEVWGNKELWDEQCWYDVNYAGNDYAWKKATDTTGKSKSGVWFVLVKE